MDLSEFIIGGVAACCACTLTNPLEVVKTRMQLQGELKARGHYHMTYRNVFHAFYTIGRVDGLVALQKGLSPALVYQFSLNSLRRGMYQGLAASGFVQRTSDGETRLFSSFLAGSMAGAVSAAISSPWFMFKTQLQSQANVSDIAVGHQHTHQSFRHAVRTTYRTFGFKGLYRGSTGIVIRVTVASGAELSTFAKARELLHKHNVAAEGTRGNVIGASLICGFFVVMAITPFDVIATRIYNQAVDKSGRGIFYRNWGDCVYKILTQEGPLAFYKGLSASFFRMGPHTLISLVLWEEFRQRYARFQMGISEPKTGASFEEQPSAVWDSLNILPYLE